MEKIRTAIIEDNRRYRDGLNTFLNHSKKFTVVDAYGNAEDALRDARRWKDRGEATRWDLVLMDIELPRMGGIAATRRLRALFPELNVVMLTVFEDPRVILEAISAGAHGYVLKKSTARELISHLETVIEGGAPLSPAVASTMIDLVRTLQSESPQPGAGPDKPTRLNLTDRELDVLRCLVRGRSYLQTANDLKISLSTVRTHVRSIYEKLHVHSVAQAIRKALDSGLA